MNTLKANRIFLALVCLTLMLALTIGKVNASPTLQAETDFAAIDAYITEQMNGLGIPGMALGIVQDGQIAHVQGYGVADSSGRTVTPQTPFYIGSLTKSFTALAVMQLVEAGKIDLDAPVQTYLPWFELADKEASAKITVRNLLNQTTGISGKDGSRDVYSQQGLEDEVRGLTTIQLTQPVGETWQYSNVNYNIAGLIVEKVSGQSYADYVTEYIFAPLDMRHSYASHPPALADGLSAGHLYMFGHAFERELVRPPAHLPSGQLIASAMDLTHYAIAHLNDGRYGDAPLLSPQGIAELHAPAIPAVGDRQYAMGWFVSTWDGIPAIWHDGNDGVFHSIVMLMPERGSGFVLLANAFGLEQATQVDEIAKGVVSLLNGKPPVAVALPISNRFLYWTVLLMPLLQIVGIAYSWRYWRNKGVGHIIFTMILYSSSALLCLFGVPVMLGHTIWSGIRFAWPDLAYGLIAGAVLGIGWSVIYTAMSLKARRSK